MKAHSAKLVGLLAGCCLAVSGLALASERIDLPDDIVHGGKLETRNAPIRVGDRARVDGLISSRNGSIQLGEQGQYRDVSSRNGAIGIGAASQVGLVEARNGSIELGRSGVARRLETRNGSITVGAGSRVEAGVETRNGSVRIAPDAAISGDVLARNGRITLEQGSQVAGDVATRNGAIRLQAAEVIGKLFSRTGDVELGSASQLVGDITIEVAEISSGWSIFGNRPSYPDAGHIRILDGSTVDGDVVIRLPDNYNGQTPTVFVDAASKVSGRILVDARVELRLEGETGQVERR